jgi:hypothetical protein
MMEIYEFHKMHEYLFSIFILLPLAEQQTPIGAGALSRLRHTFEQLLPHIKKAQKV